jgi:hypothetical protein
MAKKSSDIVMREYKALVPTQPSAIAVSEMQARLDNIILGGLNKMSDIIHSDEVIAMEIEGKNVLRIVETRDKVAAFNAVINAGKYLETRKRNEQEVPNELDFSDFGLIDGEESERHGLHPAS